MKKLLITALGICVVINSVCAQDKEEEKKKEFKENLFTGGSISLAFYNNTFLVGGSPVFGYSLTNWLVAGIGFFILDFLN